MFKVVNLIKSYFSFNLKATMEYRSAFISQLFAVFINNGTFLIFWYLILNRVGGNINGVYFNDIVMMWAIVATSFGFSEVFFGNSPRISSIIYKGELDVYILQPKPVLINLISSRMSVLGWGDIFYGFVIFFINFGLDYKKIILFIIFSITGTLVFTAFRVLIHSLTFFIGNNESLSTTLENIMITLGVYPSSIFRGPIMLLFYTIFPVFFMVYLPINLLNEFSIYKIIILLLGDFVFMVIAFSVFYFGLKKYESGNLIGSRM
ncbi:MAG: ABC-2 family transporter protein [Spirochaetales bacterium]|nr:ABC-2 family transporter protein [Spirochaetales bacterium]